MLSKFIKTSGIITLMMAITACSTYSTIESDHSVSLYITPQQTLARLVCSGGYAITDNVLTDKRTSYFKKQIRLNPSKDILRKATNHVMCLKTTENYFVATNIKTLDDENMGRVIRLFRVSYISSLSRYERERIENELMYKSQGGV